MFWQSIIYMKHIWEELRYDYGLNIWIWDVSMTITVFSISSCFSSLSINAKQIFLGVPHHLLHIRVIFWYCFDSQQTHIRNSIVCNNSMETRNNNKTDMPTLSQQKLGEINFVNFKFIIISVSPGDKFGNLLLQSAGKCIYKQQNS